MKLTPIEVLERKIELKHQYLMLLCDAADKVRKEIFDLMEQKAALIPKRTSFQAFREDVIAKIPLKMEFKP